MNPKPRHLKAAHRLYMIVFLSNSYWFDDPVSSELNCILYPLARVCYPEVRKGKHPFSRKEIKTALRGYKKRVYQLLTPQRWEVIKNARK